MIDHLVLWATQCGLTLVFINVLLEQAGLPIPAVPTLIITGGLAAKGQLSAPQIFCVAFFASLIADVGWYAAGRVYGNRVMAMLCRISLSPDSCVRQTRAKFEQLGASLLLFAKFIPGLSIVATPLAGATRVPALSFLIYNSLGIAMWVGAAVGVGELFSAQIDTVLARMQGMGGAVLLVVAAALAAYIGFKWWERRRFFKMLRMARITVEELYRLVSNGDEPVIVDVRTPALRELDGRLIPGAVAVGISELKKALSSIAVDRDIILYCTCPNEATAAIVAKQVMDLGFKRVRPLLGGLEAWAAAGFPIEPVSARSRADSERCAIYAAEVVATGESAKLSVGPS